MELTDTKILIVEDDPAVYGALKDRFTESGFSINIAENSAKGLERALAEHPDIILLDIIMPVMDGMTMLGKLRADVWGKTVPVIALTNLNKDDEVIEKGPKDFILFLTKTDWTLDDLVFAVKKALKIY